MEKRIDAYGRLPYREITHAADGVCRSRGWHTNECAEAQGSAQAALTIIGVLVALGILVYALRE